VKLSVLVDNNTYIDTYLIGEPALSYYIEDADVKILFDTGYSDVFIRNAEKLGLDLSGIDALVFSHGHNDHTGGLSALSAYMNLSGLKTIAHPLCFCRKTYGKEEIGAPFRTEKMKEICDLRLSSKPLKISEHILFLGEIPALNDHEKRRRMGSIEMDGVKKDDLLLDDTALVYKNDNGIFLITGCSHSGICNMIEYAKNICKTEKVLGVIGGFHLFRVDNQLNKTIKYFEDNDIKLLYPSHCVSFQAKAKMNEKLPIHEVGVGMTLEL
jgi:7,8-dihydropterin-6-yl-methyl-4-(beta-D-ribofuranosyl)aminobenzene 5'-phosphate synthase